MNIQLLMTLPMKRKRDLLRARQVARQAADLLGFNGADQICVAAAVFDLSCQSLTPTGRAEINFEIVDNQLQIICAPKPTSRSKLGDTLQPLKIVKMLPDGATVPRDDVPWMLQKLAEMAPLDLFEEVRKINQDLLTILLSTSHQRDAQPTKKEPSAA